MVAAYAIDKQFATLLGRPPFIASLYCDIESPLDLSWTEIIATPEVRQAALQNLDEHGWKVNKTSLDDGGYGIIDLLVFKIREKVLALSLSPHPDGLSDKA